MPPSAEDKSIALSSAGPYSIVWEIRERLERIMNISSDVCACGERAQQIFVQANIHLDACRLLSAA